MINIYCYNWNFKLPPQELLDSNCGYHAIRNGSLMLNILNNKNSISDLKSNNKLNDKLNKYYSVIKKNSLSRDEMYKIINSIHKNENIFIIYFHPNINILEKDKIRLKEVMKRRNYNICFIIFKNKLNIVKHWIPIVLKKKSNNVKLYILDSYDMLWNGDNDIETLLNYLYKNYKLKCIDNYYKGNIYYFITKTIQLIIIIISIYLFINGYFLKRN